MLKFKKNGIFSRSASEEATASELQEGGVVAVWGSPGSGKTTMAVKIAKYLADKKRNVVLLLCDMTAPMLPCICPASELECERSLGSVLAAAHVTENLVKNNLITHKRLGYLTILGMLKGENEYTYADKQELEEAIIRRHYASSIEDEENQVDQGAAAAGGLSQGMRPEANRRKPALRP